MKALVIDEPWIGKILRGEKLWEMRKTACHQRGRVALIRKGSGLVVGTADLVDSLSPIATRQAYAEAESFHGIPPDRQERAFVDGWTTPWVLANARPLTPPIAYQHPSGAVIWVNLEDVVAAAVVAQAGAAAATPTPAHTQNSGEGKAMLSPAPKPRPSTELGSPQPMPRSTDTREVVVTGGNIRNNHIYLPLDFFPNDVIGGSNKAATAPRSISVTFQPGVTI